MFSKLRPSAVSAEVATGSAQKTRQNQKARALCAAYAQGLRRAGAFLAVGCSLAGCASADLILEHEQAHTIKFDWHRPGARDREPPMELRLAALPANTVVHAYDARGLVLACLSSQSLACTERDGDGWAIRMLDRDVAGLVAKGRLAPGAEPGTYVDAKRAVATSVAGVEPAKGAPPQALR